MRTRKDYGKNLIRIAKKPELGIIRDGINAGSPCIKIECGIELEFTNESLRDYINENFPLTHNILFTGEDPTLFSNELWSFIKYCRKTSEKTRRFIAVTDGHKYIQKFLYELDQITINVHTPSTKIITPPEFISWIYEDKFLTNKTETVFVVDKNIEDVNYVRFEIPKIGSYREPITLRQGKGWVSYSDFCSMFVSTTRYPHLKLLPDLEDLCLV